MKLLTDHQALEPLIKRNRSNKTYSARLTRWLDRLAHFTINVNHTAGKHLALTDYLSKNPTAPPQANEAYDEEYVINNILPHYKFMFKYGCLSNQKNQSNNGASDNERKTNNKPRSKDAREQTAIDCRKSSTFTHAKFIVSNLNSFKPKMYAKTIDSIEPNKPSQETTDLIQRWRDIVKPGIYRMTGGKWKKYHEPKFLRNERKVIEERLQQIINSQKQGDLRQRIEIQQKRGFQPQTRRTEQWTVDPFWDIDRPTLAQLIQYVQPGTSTSNIGQGRNTPVPMEEGEIDSETDKGPSVLEGPAIKWARYVGDKSVQYVKMGHAPKITAEDKNWDLEQVVRETEKNVSNNLQLLMTETTNDPNLLKTLVCLERLAHVNSMT